MADPAVDLTTLEAAKAYLAGVGVALPDDEVLELLITAVSARIQAYLGRQLPSQDYTVRLSGRGEAAVFLPNTPITAVAALRISGVDVPPAQSGRDNGYIVERDAIYLRGYFAERGVMNVEVIYTGGFTNMPADIVQAAHEALRGTLASAEYAPGAKRLKAGNHEIEFAGLVAIASQCVTPDITSMLAPHRRVVPC